MLGVLANAVGIIVGALLGMFLCRWVSRELTERLEMALGVCTIVIGVKMALEFQNVFLMLGSIVIGGILGSLLKVEDRMASLGSFVEKKMSGRFQGDFAKGMTVCSIVFCTGAMAVVGLINSGVSGDHEILYAKAILDATYSFAIASVYGIGVAFSVIAVVLYQGMIVLLSRYLEVLTTPSALAELSGVGGVLLIMIGLNISGIRKIPVGDFLPAIAVVMVVLVFMA